jgi:hypothetical protein
MEVGFIVFNVVGNRGMLKALKTTKLQKIVFNTFYTWILAHYSLLVFSFADFLNLCSSFSSI